MVKRNPQWPSFDFIFDEVKTRLDRQLDSIEGLTNRAGIILGFVAAILSFTVPSLFQTKSLSVFVIGVVPFIFSIAMCLPVLLSKPYQYRRDPDPRNLSLKYLKKKEKVTKKQVLGNFIESFEVNQETIKTQRKFINWAFVLLFAGTIINIVIGFIVNGQ